MVPFLDVSKAIKVLVKRCNMIPRSSSKSSQVAIQEIALGSLLNTNGSNLIRPADHLLEFSTRQISQGGLKRNPGRLEWAPEQERLFR